jgi:hypothetical protein
MNRLENIFLMRHAHSAGNGNLALYRHVPSGTASSLCRVILRAGQFYTLRTDAGRRQIRISPNRRSAVRGTACIAPQLRKDIAVRLRAEINSAEIVNSSERAISLAQGNALCRKFSSDSKPQRGVIRFVSLDYALSGLDNIALIIRRALPCAIDYALSELVTHLYPDGYVRKEWNHLFPSNMQGIELRRSSEGALTVYPELRFACTGLSKLDACGGCPKSQSRRHCERSEAIQNTVNHWIASGYALAMTGLDPFWTPPKHLYILHSIPRAGKFCALRENSVRSLRWITPNKRSAVRGKLPHLSELRSSSTPYGVVEEKRFTPCCALLARGYQNWTPAASRRREAFLHFYLTILARAI